MYSGISISRAFNGSEKLGRESEVREIGRKIVVFHWVKEIQGKRRWIELSGS